MQRQRSELVEWSFTIMDLQLRFAHSSKSEVDLLETAGSYVTFNANLRVHE